MNLQNRIALLSRLGEFLVSDDAIWQEKKILAERNNPWFTQDFIHLSIQNIVAHFLQKKLLETWTTHYLLPTEKDNPKTVGVVMAGNLPLVGFQDWLSIFITGHKQRIKLSSKDNILLPFIIEKMIEWDREVTHFMQIDDMLKGCDAYIATGSNNAARYFEYYFAQYPHIIRRNRTSVAILDGSESPKDLEKLADDVHLYFGLGCRNVTKIYVPNNYDFIPLLQAFKKYNYFFEHDKYRNNYDYQLAINLMNKKEYMSSGSLLLIESKQLFSPIAAISYTYYNHIDTLNNMINNMEDIQCVVSKDSIPFGHAQQPSLFDYADGIDTIHFLKTI